MRRSGTVLAIGLALSLAPQVFAGPDVGEPAPDFLEPDTAGVLHGIAEFSGRPVLLNFWTSW